MENENKALNNSLDKALKLLTYFNADRRIIGLSELSRLSNIPKATVYRLISTLQAHGFISKVSILGKDNQYKLGLRFLEYGKLVSEDLEIRKIALPYMERFRDKVNECVQLIIRDNDEAMYIEKLECTRDIRLYTRTGRRAPLFGGACPRAILTFLPDDEIDRILESRPLVKVTEGTIVNKIKLIELIKQDRQRGYTISYGELEPETVAIGAPIFDHMGSVIASVSVAGPDSRFTEKEIPYLLDELLRTTKDISTALGYIK
ncbi:MAG TPA: IclR family transcriptional regulator [Clostridia bacterium]|nr:IclR family transcriptional regulator [Clostridia bacterium]